MNWTLVQRIKVWTIAHNRDINTRHLYLFWMFVHFQTKSSGNCLFHAFKGCLQVRHSGAKDAVYFCYKTQVPEFAKQIWNRRWGFGAKPHNLQGVLEDDVEEDNMG